MDTQTIWHFFVWLAGCSVPAATVLYLVTRLGNILSERITNAVDAYSEERAKLTAQFHGLDKLVEQTDKLTKTAETIKAQIQHSVWETQTTLTLKREIYTRLLEAIGQMIEDQQESKFLETVRRTELRDLPELAEKHKASGDRLSVTMQKWSRAVDIAPVLISVEAYALLPTVFQGLFKLTSTAYCSLNSVIGTSNT